MKGMLLAACGLGAALLLAGPQAMAEPLAYRLDPVHSRILFRVDHNGFSRVMGTFSRPQGVLFFDPEDWTTARLDVRVDLATLELGDDGFNARILAPAWLDAGAFPEARFVSERVEPIDENHARVHGTLRLRGVQAPLTLEVRLNRLARTPYNAMRRTAGFSAVATLSRAAFGLRASRRAVGDAVRLEIEVEAIRTRDAQ